MSPATADTPVGAPGIAAPTGTTLLEANSGLEPCALLAETWNWYATFCATLMLVDVGGNRPPLSGATNTSGSRRPLDASYYGRYS